ncbi:hypothetical protein [Algibacillus agarilyticus]|uniref:hypothetical protein n=1 Tax=Algibacillus agarilyticus TaxID=2234133 RepID=UPI000DCFF0CA|nr:hypothetical protein [Algibacillus agarilyticus]
MKLTFFNTLIVLTMLIAFTGQLLVSVTMKCEMPGNTHRMIDHANAQAKLKVNAPVSSHSVIGHAEMDHAAMGHSVIDHASMDHSKMHAPVNNDSTEHTNHTSMQNNDDCCGEECKCPTHACTSVINFMANTNLHYPQPLSTAKIVSTQLNIQQLTISSLYRPPILA